MWLLFKLSYFDKTNNNKSCVLKKSFLIHEYENVGSNQMFAANIVTMSNVSFKKYNGSDKKPGVAITNLWIQI